MELKYYVILGAILGGIIGIVVAKLLDFHMWMTTVFFVGLGFLAVERQIREKLPKEG